MMLARNVQLVIYVWLYALVLPIVYDYSYYVLNNQLSK